MSFPKKSPHGENEKFRPNFTQNCGSSSVQRIFLIRCSMMDNIRYTKVASVSFFHNTHFLGKWAILTKFGPNCSKDFLETLVWRGRRQVGRQNRETIKIIVVNFPKKFCFKSDEQFGPKFVQNYPSLYLMICSKVLKITLFWGKWAIGLRLAPNYGSLYLMNISRNFELL